MSEMKEHYKLIGRICQNSNHRQITNDEILNILMEMQNDFRIQFANINSRIDIISERISDLENDIYNSSS